MSHTNLEGQALPVLFLWPSNGVLPTIDPHSLAALLWIRANGYSFDMVNVDKQIQLTLGTYPSLFDPVSGLKQSFESIYQWTIFNKPTIERPSADVLALLSNFQQTFVPACIHNLWLDETNKEFSRTIYCTSIGLPSSFLFIYSKQNHARTTFNIAATKFSWQPLLNQENKLYEKAEQCLNLIDEELGRRQSQYIFGENISLVDVWVSSYLLILQYCSSKRSKLIIKLQRCVHLLAYLKRIENKFLFSNEYQKLSLLSNYNNQVISMKTKTKSLMQPNNGSISVLSVLHILSQIVSFSVFFLMLSKIGGSSSSSKLV